MGDCGVRCRDAVRLRRSKQVGYAVICLGLLLIVGAAVLPVSQATQRLGPFRVNLRDDSCGPAVEVAFSEANTDCGTAAAKRLVPTTGIGLMIVVLGMALFAGGDAPHGTRIDVPSPRLRRGGARRPARRPPGRSAVPARPK